MHFRGEMSENKHRMEQQQNGEFHSAKAVTQALHCMRMQGKAAEHEN